MLGLILFGWAPSTQADPTEKTTQYVIGTVSAIDSKQIVVTTSKGVTVSVKLTKYVQFKNKNNPQSHQPPTVDDRVIIKATKHNKTLIATVVHYSPVGQTPEPPE